MIRWWGQSSTSGCRLRALAVTGAARSDVLPDIPTVGDFVPGYESSGWHGVAAPKNTPTEIIDSSTRKSTSPLPNPGSRNELPILAVRCLRAHRPTSANSSSRKRRNGPRWSSSRARSRKDDGTATYSINPVARMAGRRRGDRIVVLSVTRSLSGASRKTYARSKPYRFLPSGQLEAFTRLAP